MGGYYITGLQFFYRPHHFAILGEQGVSHAVDTLGVTGRKSLFEQFDAMLADEDLSFGGALQAYQQICYACHLVIHPMNEPFRNSSRGFQRLMRYEIKYRHIPRMSDSGDDRQVELRADGAERAGGRGSRSGQGRAARIPLCREAG